MLRNFLELDLSSVLSLPPVRISLLLNPLSSLFLAYVIPTSPTLPSLIWSHPHCCRPLYSHRFSSPVIKPATCHPKVSSITTEPTSCIYNRMYTLVINPLFNFIIECHLLVSHLNCSWPVLPYPSSIMTKLMSKFDRWNKFYKCKSRPISIFWQNTFICYLNI